jgi:hypothetical protein
MGNDSNLNSEKAFDNVMKLYNEINENIRFTDEISFKLLGLVPLISGAGIAGLILSNLNFTPYGALISFFAAIVTSALFMWELRNMQICKFYIDRLKEIEINTFKINEKDAGRPKGRLRGIISKRIAEYIIYGSTIGSWIIFGITILSHIK